MAARRTVIKKIIVGRPLRKVDVAAVGNASQLASNPPSYYLDYNNFTNTPNVLDSADVNALIAVGGVDSSEIQGIIDSAYVNALLDTTQFLDSAEAIALIDSDYILARASNIQNLRDSGSDTIITGALLPATDSAQDIGSFNRKFKDLYLSGSTLYIGNVAIGIDDSNNVKIFQLDNNGNITSTQGKIALVDSAEPTQDVRSIIDSDYINLRLDDTLFLDSNEVITLVDSNYVAARTFTQSDIEGFARGVSLDSAEAIALIDSNYIKGIVDSSYVKGFIDTAYIETLVDSAYVSLRDRIRDSNFVEAIIDSDYITARASTYDSDNTIGLVDSAYVRARGFQQSEIEDFARGVSLDSAETIALVDSDYVLARAHQNLRDSGTAIRITGSIIPDGTGIDLGSWTNKFRSIFAGGNTIYIGNLALQDNGDGTLKVQKVNPANGQPTADAPEIVATFDSAEVEAIVQPNIDSAINALVDGAPGVLDTLNEIAEALNDDSDAFNTLLTNINTRLRTSDFNSTFDTRLATKSTSDVAEGTNLYYTDARAQTAAGNLIDSAYINARLDGSQFLDSAETIALIDSDYVNARATSEASSLTLGTVADGSLTDGAFKGFTSDTILTQAIDDLNETILNVSNNTFVRDVSFSGSPLSGGEGITVTLSITPDGNANRYDIYWGDGNVDSAVSTTTPSHTYNTNGGSPFSVTVRAFNNSGTGAGSEAESTRTDYVVVFTGDPVAAFNIYANPTGGSPINFWDDSATVYLDNTTSNTTSADVEYTVNWGDGNTEKIDSDNAPGGRTGGRLAHTFTSNSADVQRTITLTLDSHSTADPSVIPSTDTDTFEIYDSFTPAITNRTAFRRINPGTIAWRNDTSGNVGSFATFGNQWRWNWGDTTTNTVNVGNGQAGNVGASDISHTWTLPDSDQTNGHTVSYDVTLDLLSNHTNSHSSVARTADGTTIFIEPAVLAKGTLVAAYSSRDEFDDNDSNNVLYAIAGQRWGFPGGVSYSTNWRGSIAHDATASENNSTITWKFGDAGVHNSNISGNANLSGTLGATLSGTYGVDSNTGEFDVVLEVTGQPDTISQTNTRTYTMNVKNTPPLVPVMASSSTHRTLSWDRTQSADRNGRSGAVPKLVANFSIVGDFGYSRAEAGARVDQGEYIRLWVGDSAYVEPIIGIGDGGQIDGSNNVSTTFRMYANGTASGNNIGAYQGDKTNITEGGSGHGWVNIDSNYDYSTLTPKPSGSVKGFWQAYNVSYSGIGDYAFPSGNAGNRVNYSRVNYLRADQVTQNNSEYGFSNGVSNILKLVYDAEASLSPSIRSEPGTPIEIETQGTYRYISGIPYFGTGSPQIKLTNLVAVGLLGSFVYTDEDDIIEVDLDETFESRTQNPITTSDFGYSDFLQSNDIQSGIPKMSASSGSINDLVLDIASNTRTVGSIKFRTKNVDHQGTYQKPGWYTSGTPHPTEKIQVHTAAQSGINETAIAVSDALGSTYDDDAVRIFDFSSSTTATPAMNTSTNYYTNSVFGEASDPGVEGTQEATVRWGVIKHDTTDYSTNYIPVGPDRSGDTGTQYFTMAFRRTLVNSFDVNITSSGITSFHVALPGDTAIDFSGDNDWLDAGKTFGDDNGCANTNGDRIQASTSLSGSYSMQLGTGNASNSTNNVILIRIGVASGQSVTALSIS